MGKLEPQPHGGALYRPDKGETPNPAGQPKGTQHLSTVIQNLMNDDDFELKLKNGTVLKGKPSRKIVETMYALAVSGNTRAAEWLAKHGYGTKIVHDFESGLFTENEMKITIVRAKYDRTDSERETRDSVESS